MIQFFELFKKIYSVRFTHLFAVALLCFSSLASSTPNIENRYQDIHNFMQDYIANTPATSAVLQVREYDTVGGITTVFRRGYGVLENGNATPANALFRTASVTKPITALATKTLIENGALTWQTRVFCSANETPNPVSANGCVIPHQGSGFQDTDFYTITVQHLVTHRSGVSNPTVSDVIGTLEGQNIFVPTPPSILDYITYLQGTSLDYAPGPLNDPYSTGATGAPPPIAYSNMGFDLLAHVVASASNSNSSIPSSDRFEQYVQSMASANHGVDPLDIQLAGAEVGMRVPGREPEYVGHQGYCESLFTPGSWVHHQDGCGLYGQKPGAGGLVVTTDALLNIMQNNWFEPYSRPRPTRPIIEENYRVLDRENGYFAFWPEEQSSGGGWGTLSRTVQNVHADNWVNSDPRADVAFIANFHQPGGDDTFENGILPLVRAALAVAPTTITTVSNGSSPECQITEYYSGPGYAFFGHQCTGYSYFSVLKYHDGGSCGLEMSYNPMGYFLAGTCDNYTVRE